MEIESTITKTASTHNSMSMEITEGLFTGVKYTIHVEDPTPENPQGGISYGVDNQEVLQDICLNMFRQVVENDFDQRTKDGYAMQEAAVDKDLLTPKE